MQRIALQTALLAMLLTCAAQAFAAERELWRIGTFDRSSGEFRSQDIDYAKQDLVFRIGENKDADWWRFQPGPANGMTGGREHPFTIIFDLGKKPSGVYRLKIAMLYETPRLSYLGVGLNGHFENIYFHPRLDYSAGDWEGTFVPQTSADEKTIEFPAAWLATGENRLVLTAMDDPPGVENSFGAIAPGHTGLVYDALAMTNDPAAAYDPLKVEVKVQPTIFYRQGDEGTSELVEAFVTCGQAAECRDITLRVGPNAAKPAREGVSGTSPGEHRLEFSIPEWTETVDAELRVGPRSFPLRLTAAKKWTVFIVPNEHLDIGFTDYPEKVAELHAQSIDGAAELIRKYPGFRWTLDGYWVAEQYLAGRSKPKQDEFLQLIREGKIILPPQFANQHTGTASLEGLIRSLYDSHTFAAKNGLPTGAAHITDVPSYSWSYASVLHDAGSKYFVAASNSWRAPVVLMGRWNEKSPFYWEGPDGGRVLMWYSRAYLQLGTLFATPPRIAAVRDALPVFLQAYSRPDFKADAAIVFGTQLENTPLSPEQAELVGEWNKQYAWPRLEYSTFAEAMSSIEHQAGGRLPVYRGDFGPYWEDGFGSDAAATAVHRQNQQRILSAEKLGTVPAVLDPAVRPDGLLLSRAWHHSLMFDEHTWTYVAATTQPDAEQTRTQTELKRAQVTSAMREITESTQRSWAQLGTLINPKEASTVAFNALNWPRGGLVEQDLQDGQAIFDTVTGKEVPVETLYVGKSQPLPGFGGGYRRVRFYADAVPALGYRVFAIRPSQSQSAPGDAPYRETFESPYYKIAIDAASGALRSVFDKQLGKELADQSSPYRFGAYVYVTGADDMPNNSLYRYGAALHPPQLTPVPAGSGHIVGVRAPPFATIIEVESKAPHTPHIRTEITLYNNQRKIGLKYQITKEYVLSKEAVYVAFPFAADKPSFAYETQNGWVDPAKDELAGGSREWYTATHWAAVHGSDIAAAVFPVDAPLVNFGDIVRGLWPAEFKPKSSAIFSWLMNNYWGTNFVSGQGGDFTFRYEITSGPEFDAAALTRTGWEALTPLESTRVNPASFTAGPLPQDQASVLDIGGADVAAVTWKLAEDGRGSILRLQEIGGRTGQVRVVSEFLQFEKVWRCSVLEDDCEQLPVKDGVQLPVKPFEIITLRLLTRPASSKGKP